MSTLFRLVSGVISVYMMLIFVRVIMTWFAQTAEGKPMQLLRRATDPYLDLFRRIRFLRTDRIDFSPIAAIIVLVVVLNITNTLAAYGSITLGFVLALILSAAWSTISLESIFLMFLIASIQPPKLAFWYKPVRGLSTGPSQ